MKYSTFHELYSLIRDRLGEPFIKPNQLYTLPKASYLQLLDVLYEALQLGVASEMQSAVRGYFNHRWAAKYYRDILEWTLSSDNWGERINYERAVQVTYSKKHAEWTMARLLTVPPEKWPSLIFRHLIRDLGRVEVLMHGIFQTAETSRNDVYILCNLVATNDPELLARINGFPELPRLVQRKLDARLGTKRVPKAAKLTSRDLTGFEHRWSAEVDDCKISQTIRAGFGHLMWQWDENCTQQLAQVDEDTVPDKGRVLLLSTIEDRELRWVVGEREDSTTVILLWIAKMSSPETLGVQAKPTSTDCSGTIH